MLGEEFEVVAVGVVPLVDAAYDVSGDGSQHDVLRGCMVGPRRIDGAGNRKSSPGRKSFLAAHGPLRAGFGTLITVIRLPGGHRARSLAPLCMCGKQLRDQGMKSQSCHTEVLRNILR